MINYMIMYLIIFAPSKKKKKKFVCPHIFIFCHDVFTLHFILLSIISISIYLHVSNSEKIDWHPFMLINPPQLYWL